MNKISTPLIFLFLVIIFGTLTSCIGEDTPYTKEEPKADTDQAKNPPVQPPKKIPSGSSDQILLDEVLSETQLKNAIKDSQDTLNILNIPLTAKDRWHNISYKRRVPANEVEFSPKGLIIKVNNSTSAVIRSFNKQTLNIKKISIKGYLDQILSIAKPTKQGKSSYNDFNLALGLIVVNNKPKSSRRFFSMNWIIDFTKEALPQDRGIDHVYFINAFISPTLMNTNRWLYQKRMRERNTWLMDQPGDFSYSYTFPEAQESVAIWVASDGDDTNSQFTITINELILGYQ